ncbi:hsp90 co-chaperone Cdc37-like [Liolophura sinensis]|uniref:hsp90 co-chaperone Cdc37-like n=1 Tax=Liolophura sinensis TaxID=3198878 RepID=UPI0031596F8E
MSRLDYSKWDHIEISDDEDDTHPNIDTASLFRWRHNARVERMEQKEAEKKEILQNLKSKQQKMAEMKQKLQEVESTSEEFKKLQLEISNLEEQEKEWKKKEEELEKKEKSEPWNIDTICKEGKSRTVINKSKPKREELTEEEKAEKQRMFVNKYREDIKKFGMFKRYEDSQAFLLEKKHLVCEETANYLVVWCIDLEIEEKKDLMHHVAHQTIVMQFILELAKQLDRDPRECVGPFFSRMKLAEQQYMDSFTEELEAFKDRVRKRAQQRIEEALAEHEEEEKKKRLGPGGLDPVEVFESLPEVLKDCFEKKDIGMLQKAILELPKDEAEYHMKRCVESGLWVPNAADAQKAEASGSEPTQESEYADIHAKQ